MTSESETEYEICERCEKETPESGMINVSLSEEWWLCDACVEEIEEGIEDYYWYDRYTKEQHKRALEILRDHDEIYCVHGNAYEAGEIIVHTPYVASAVVEDVCDHFGLQISAFRPRWEEDYHAWECVEGHGSCFEILLEYKQNSQPPVPLEMKFVPVDIEYLDENDKQF